MDNNWCSAQNIEVGSPVARPCYSDATREIIETRKNGKRVSLPMCSKHAAHYAEKAGYEYRLLNESDADYATRLDAQRVARSGAVDQLRAAGATDDQLRKAGLI